jgi:hypothetical protein
MSRWRIVLSLQEAQRQSNFSPGKPLLVRQEIASSLCSSQ